MRKQLVKTVIELLEKDGRVVLLLGDIGVYGFREAFERFPKRVYNIGILEQASVGLAAGLAQAGMIPIFHTIAPFMVERAFEQIKIDFGYQRLKGIFVSVGASYDYSGLGSTHHCPGDVALMETIPGMSIYVPGHSEELDDILQSSYRNDRTTYIRLSERTNEKAHFIPVIRAGGSKAIVIAIGPMLDKVLEATKNLRVEVWYSNQTVSRDFKCDHPLVVVQPYYEGCNLLRSDKPVLSIGVPHKFLTKYGKPEDLDKMAGLTVEQIRERIEEFIC